MSLTLATNLCLRELCERSCVMLGGPGSRTSLGPNVEEYAGERPKDG